MSSADELHSQIHYRLMEELSRVEGRYRFLVENLRQVVVEVDAEGRITFLNPAWKEQLGYDLKGSLGRRFDEFLDPSSDAARLPSGANPGPPVQLQLLHAKGHRVWFDVSFRPPVEGRRLGELWNVDSHRKLLAQLADRERESERLALVASRTHNAVIITDANARTVWVNEAFTRITGYRPDEVIGRTPGSVLQGADTDPQTMALMRAKIRACEPFRTEVLNYRKDGSKYWLDLEVQPVFDAAGEVVQYIAVEQEITARKETEQRLREQSARLEEQGRLAALRAEVGAELNRDAPLPTILAGCCDTILRHSGGAFARVWTLDENTDVLTLQVSRGLYTHTDGGHARIPVGAYKIGRIAQTRQPVVTNQVIGDPCVHQQEWAAREGMVAFAGHPLVHADRVVGVLGVFSRTPFSPSTADAFQVVADALALAVVRHVARDQLRASEARFRTFVEHATDALFLIDSDGLIADVNEVACLTLRAPRTALLGRHIHTIDTGLTPSDENPWGERLRSGEPVEFDSRYRRDDGSTFPVEVRIRPFVQNGKPVSVAKVRDITQRKASEDALRAAEARQRAVLESSLDCIITIDREGRVIEFNPAAERTFGYSRETVLGTPLANLIIPVEHRSAHAAGFQRHLSTGVSRILGERLRGLPALRSDGTQFPTELTIVPMELSGETVFTAFLRDITKEQEAERQRQEAVAQIEDARQKAVAADQAKTLFFANMSHEFRTPMAAVVGYAEMLLDPQLGVDRRNDLARSITRNGRHLLALINDVLDLSKFEADQLELEHLPCRPWRTIEEALSVVDLVATERRVQLVPEVVGPLPRTFKTDPTRFRQILDNLLSNAVKFTPTGGKVFVRARMTDEPERRLRIEVEDQGIGIPEEVIRRLFRPFTQADTSTTRRYGGTGLGLSIVAKLVKAMRGTIDLRSEPGAGSCFSVTLPLDGVNFDDLTTPEELYLESRIIRQPAVSVRRLQGRVLLAEDNPDNRNIVRYFLERAGLTVVEAENGRMALELTTTEEFDLILLDMQMPELDGYSVASTLRQRCDTRVIVALTAHAMAGDEEKCLRAGCDAYLTKPVDPDRLVETVAHHLGRKSTRTRPVVTTPTPTPTVRPVFDNLENIEAAYRRDLPQKVADLKRTLAGGEVSKAREMAHRLKGSAGMYGLPEVSETAGLIEQACVEGQGPELLAELVAELWQMVSSDVHP